MQSEVYSVGNVVIDGELTDQKGRHQRQGEYFTQLGKKYEQQSLQFQDRI